MSIESPRAWVVAAVVVIALIVLAWLLVREARRRQSARLQQRFGPEYSRLLAERGDRTKAEAELVAREKRVERLKIVPLTPEDKDKFGEAWSALQARFVDSPRDVVVEADHLVRDLMVKRGYPMADFERRSADISVDYPAVVDAYRSGRAIAVRGQRGEASTEELRKAVVYYRTLFAELLEVPQTSRAEAENTEVVHP